MRGMLIAITLVLALCGCAADTSNPAASSTSPSYDGAAYARQVRDAVLEGLTTNEYQRPATFADMCQTTVSWACAIAKSSRSRPAR
jgi:ABC-type Fe3+-hydroxamate transport system substrate-binding protein